MKKNSGKTAILLWIISVLTFSSVSGQIQTITPLYPTMDQVSLNGTWKFKYVSGVVTGSDSLFYLNDFDVSGWDNIKVPGNWELQGFAEPTYGSVPAGTGLYRTSFRLPVSYRNKQVFIRFEGVLYAFNLFVNGRKIGSWSSSYNAVSFNITDVVNFDKDNILAVRVSTRCKGYQFDLCDNWALSGIFREVAVSSTPDFYMNDYTVRTLLNKDQSALMRIMVDFHNLGDVIPENILLQSLVYSPEGKLIQKKLEPATSKGNMIELTITHPELWNAETPALYAMELSLIKNGEVLQQISQKVGIREISIENAVLKLNGKPIKLRGVNYHDLVPGTGKSLTESQIRDDLLLMKKANINFIRTSHYPPDRRRLELCDSLGFYVVCEIPFAGGDEFLADTAYQNILMDRANATLLRDKNHPSVIIWSLGNENPLTPITIDIGKFVKKQDPTRPICYPGFSDYNRIHDYTDIFSPHYPDAQWVKEFAGKTDRPVVLTEYAHALGLAFGNLEDVWQEMFRNKSFAGGAVWHFEDQGILQTADMPVDRKKLTYNVWMDSLHYYKTTLEGADGIVYSDRTPQADYWQLRKVYSPVRIVEKEINITPGEKEVNLTLYNQYDFTNLSTLSGEWKLYKNRKLFRQGKVEVNCEPHDTVNIRLPVKLSDQTGIDVWLLQLRFTDKNKISVYEHSINLVFPDQYKKLKNQLCKELDKGNLIIEKKDHDSTILSNKDFIYKIGENTLSVELSTQNKIPVISSGIYARTGRIPKMADVTVRDKFYPGNGDYFWDPFLLKPSGVVKQIEQEDSDKYCFSAYSTFPRGEKFPGQSLEGEIHYTVKNTGEIVVRYHLKPVHATGVFLDAGISFILSPQISNFIWLGDGPYASYPDKHSLNDFGIHSVQKGDINFNGNRSNVEMAALTDDKGTGIAVLCDKANMAVELSDNRIILSNNSLVSGVGNKKKMPLTLIKASDVGEIEGEITIIPLSPGHWPEKIKDILGYPDQSAKAFNPFYYSYDTSL